MLGPKEFAAALATWTASALIVRPLGKLSGPLLERVTGPALTTTDPPKVLVLPLAKVTAPPLRVVPALKFTAPLLVNERAAACCLVRLPPFKVPTPPKLYAAVVLLTVIAPGCSVAMSKTTLVVALSS